MRSLAHIIEQIPLFVLGSLEADERAEIERHLHRCRACRDEIAAYRYLVDQLARIAPPPPPAARVSDATMARLQQRVAASAERLRAEHLQQRATRRRTWVLAAAVVLLAVGNVVQFAGIGGIGGGREPAGAPPDAPLTIGQPAVLELQGTDNAPQASALVVVRNDGLTGVLLAERLPPLPRGLQYQVWLVRDDGRDSAGVFTTAGRWGVATHYFRAPSPLSSYRWIGISTEPSGGSAEPTGARMLGGPVVGL